MAATAVTLPAQTFTTLHNFDYTDGDGPDVLVQGANGQLYGTTQAGGNATEGGGTFFAITTSGGLTTLFAFPCNDIGCPDGAGPRGSLIQATDGDFDGTAWGGDDLSARSSNSLRGQAHNPS